MDEKTKQSLEVHAAVTPAVVKGEAVIVVDERFAVRVIPRGAKYGLTGTITAGVPLIEFYDRRYAGKPGFHALGQFVARYQADTLEAFDGGALALDFGIPQWTVSPTGMRTVQTLASAVVNGVLS